MAPGSHDHVAADSDRVAVRDRRYVYGGERTTTPAAAPRYNRKIVRKRPSAFNIVLTIFALGAGVVLYINNILAVNRLVLEVDLLRTRLDSLANVEARLQAEVSRKSTLDRISAVAVGELGLRFPTEQPGVLEIDPERLRRIREGARER